MERSTHPIKIEIARKVPLGADHEKPILIKCFVAMKAASKRTGSVRLATAYVGCLW